MDLYFLPVNPLNFNSIFSTESVSPRSFCEIRNFGSRRFFLNQTCPYEDALCLFDFVPIVELEEDLSVFYICFHRKYLPSPVYERVENDQTVIAISDTVYFDISHPVFIFNDLKHRNALITKSLSSIETKTVEKYSARFLTLTDISKTPQEFHPALIENSVKFSDIVPKVMHDRAINSFKGLVYGHAISRLMQRPEKELELRNAIKKVQNTWASFINSLQVVKEQRKTKSKKILNIEDSLSILTRALLEFKKATARVFPPVAQLEKLVSFYKSRSVEPEDYEVLNKLFGPIPELKAFVYQLADKYFPTIDSEIEALVEEINREGKALQYSISKYDSHIIKRLSGKIENAGSKVLAQYYQKYEITKNRPIPRPPYSLKGDKIGAVLIDSDEKQNELYESILNVLFTRNRSMTTEVDINYLNEIITETGSIVKEIYGEDSDERKTMLSFYLFLNGKSFEFEIARVKSPVIANFIAFVQNYKSLESLLNFCENKLIADYHLAIEYWGLFNGFASIGKIYTHSLWDNDNGNTYRNIDATLRENLSDSIPYISTVPDEDPMKDKVATQVVTPKGTIADLLKPIKEDPDLQKYLVWVTKGVEGMLTSFGFEYPGMSHMDALKRDFEGELWSKNKPKGFTVKVLESVVSKIDMDLLEMLKKTRNN
ncbi:MAG TPA: hypothetical protein DIW47_06095 [Bacteroidetes bacterium]|nr:hypothetical protein [Bacteroidota bacterium]